MLRTHPRERLHVLIYDCQQTAPHDLLTPSNMCDDASLARKLESCVEGQTDSIVRLYVRSRLGFTTTYTPLAVDIRDNIICDGCIVVAIQVVRC